MTRFAPESSLRPYLPCILFPYQCRQVLREIVPVQEGGTPKMPKGRVVLDCLTDQSEGTSIVGRLRTLVKKRKTKETRHDTKKCQEAPTGDNDPPRRPTAPPRPTSLIALHWPSPPHDDELIPSPSPILLKSLPAQVLCVSLEVSLRQRSHCCRGRCR